MPENHDDPEESESLAKWMNRLRAHARSGETVVIRYGERSYVDASMMEEFARELKTLGGHVYLAEDRRPPVPKRSTALLPTREIPR